MEILLNRDSIGKVVNVNIFTIGGYAPVPVNLQNYEINWDSIEYEPTRDSIKSAWNEWAQGKDLTYELRVRPDLAPSQPEPVEDWNAAKYGFLSDSGYTRITSQTSNQRAVSRIEMAITDYASNANPTYSLIKSFWDAIVEGVIEKPTTVEIASWNTIASSTHMKFTFSSDAKMILS